MIDQTLAGRRVIVGICGGIAAYKAAELVRGFRKSGAEVQVLMTPDATRFVTPLTLGTLSEREVLIEIFPQNESGSWTKHVHLGRWADVFVVAPTTANTLSKLVQGACDSMLTAVALSATCPILVCPAMDHDMYVHASTQDNLAALRARGAEIMEPVHGPLASGLIGQGRLPEPTEILARVAEILARPRAGRLSGRRVLVTAGPTRERIDPVRFLSNHSTGTMGYCIAAEAARNGAHVTLVSGPTDLEAPSGVTRINVESAQQMLDAVRPHATSDLIIMAAAVADYAPAEVSSSKVKKSDDELVLRLQRTPDILAGIGATRTPDQILVGFALETDDGPKHAREKLARKHLDWIVLNNPTEPGSGFGTGTNRVTLISRDGSEHPFPLLPKPDVAIALLDHILG